MQKKSIYKKLTKFFILIIVFILTTVVIIILSKKYNSRKIEKNNDFSITNNTTNKIDYSAPSAQDKAESTLNKNETIMEMDKPRDISNNNTTQISVSITRISRSNISVYIESLNEGSCSLVITQNGIDKITVSSKIISQASYSTCEGFNIDSTKLDSSPFKATIKITSGNRTGIAIKEIE